MIESELDYQNGNIGKLFRSLFFPTLIGMLSNSVFLITDGIFVGQGIGPLGLAPSFLRLIPSYPESSQIEADLIKIYSNAIPNFEDVFGRITLGREQKPDSKKSNIFGVKTK